MHYCRLSVACGMLQDSKIGKNLMQKCRTLMEENEDMGQQLSEGRVQQADAQLAMARTYAEDLRRGFAELRDHANLLEEENEELAMALFVARRSAADYQSPQGGMQQGSRGPGPGGFGPPGGFGGGGRFDRMGGPMGRGGIKRGPGDQGGRFLGGRGRR